MRGSAASTQTTESSPDAGQRRQQPTYTNPYRINAAACPGGDIVEFLHRPDDARGRVGINVRARASRMRRDTDVWVSVH